MDTISRCFGELEIECPKGLVPQAFKCLLNTCISDSLSSDHAQAVRQQLGQLKRTGVGHRSGRDRERRSLESALLGQAHWFEMRPPPDSAG
jgi:hypothetical protein